MVNTNATDFGIPDFLCPSHLIKLLFLIIRILLKFFYVKKKSSVNNKFSRVANIRLTFLVSVNKIRTPGV